MIRHFLTCTLLCFLAAACSEESQAAGKEALERAGENLQEAGQDLAELMRLGRDAFTETVERELSRLDARIEELKGKAGAASEAAIERLEELRRQTGEKLDRLRDAGGDAWQDLREGVAEALKELERGVEEKEGGGR